MAFHHLVVSGLLALSFLQSELHTKKPNLNSSEWAMYKREFDKSYQSEEVDSMRKLIFFANKLRVDKYNEEHEHSKGRVNHLSDWSEAEKEDLLGLKVDTQDQSWRRNSVEGEQFLKEILARDVPVPDELDWRDAENRVSRVQEQGPCRSSWAFAAAGALEGQELPQRNMTTLAPLSVQELVDCAYLGTDGCKGGAIHDGMMFARNGLETAKDYPYEAKYGPCRFLKSKAVIEDSGYVFLPEGDEEMMKQVVAKFGPIPVGIDASLETFQTYEFGVYLDGDCGRTLKDVNHAALIVGYGHVEASNLDYWLVKNSWGRRWGEQGYIRIARNENNTCAISSYASVPIFRNPGAPSSSASEDKVSEHPIWDSVQAIWNLVHGIWA